MAFAGVMGSCETNKVNFTLLGSETCFIEDKNQTLKPYLDNLMDLNSGQKLIEKLNELKNCGLKLMIEEKPLVGESFGEAISVSEISNRQVKLILPPYIPSCKINIPILCKKGEGFCVQNVPVPTYIVVGHELVHFIHKAEAFRDVRLEHPSSTVTEDDIREINNWYSHRDNSRAIATLYGFYQENSNLTEKSNLNNSDNSLDPVDFNDDSDDSLGLMNFDDDDFYSNFEGIWGNVKAYEELKTITGKQTNGLSRKTSDGFKFESSELDISERHLLCDYFAKNQLPSALKEVNKPPFVTRWTHALNAEEINKMIKEKEKDIGHPLNDKEINKTFFDLVTHLLTDEEIDHLPTVL